MPSLPIGEAFTELAARAPDRVAVRCGDEVLTRSQLDARAASVAGRWVEDGLDVDDVVAICLPNGIDLVVACVAAWKAGGVPLAIASDLPVRERQAVLDAAAPAVVVDRPEVARRPGPPLVESRTASSWKLSTSSGTTGTPKLIRAAAAATVDPDGLVAPFVPRDAVQLVSGPLTHAAPFTYAMRGLMTGHELVLLPRFDAGEWLAAVERHRVTWAMLVPTTMQRIWRHPDRDRADVSSLASVLHLGARCAPDLKRSWIGWLGPERVVEVYAGTESQGLTMIDGREWLDRPGSVGRPCAGSRFRVVDGELQMQRDGGLPGWHSLGDAGRIDDAGYVYVLDRLDDVVVSGGVNVHPADVEAVLDSHPLVRSSVVVPRPDGDLGHRVHAVVETDEADEDVLRDWARERLRPELRPRSYELVTEPLRATTGKSRRRDWR
ncbi:hypothetical protein ASD11_02080 [Aeromicrobium sp. Root495]|uniref:AMP-binding protein n=1 Tax=Aeromicrobium sp. Root495 TaxID=1736550 RepID=UPI0006FD76CD|nr:AMP-binding protein [Aeromicrobium sp. Root495]KQY58476.1 hypothetical protein ASD11_02080 [Aeromicrobium sp. Root495]